MEIRGKGSGQPPLQLTGFQAFLGEFGSRVARQAFFTLILVKNAE
jgi:hypothetical protein